METVESLRSCFHTLRINYFILSAVKKELLGLLKIQKLYNGENSSSSWSCRVIGGDGKHLDTEQKSGFKRRWKVEVKAFNYVLCTGMV